MNKYVQRFLFALAIVSPAAAQSAATYVNTSTNGTYVYSTGVIQYTPPSPCTGMCTDATHTYVETVKITSPSGRTASCSTGNQQAAASNPDTVQCEAELAIDADYGQYTLESTPYADCSVVGVFLNASIFSYISIGQATAYYTNGVAEPYGCYYPSLACLGTTQPSCTGFFTIDLDASCTAYRQVIFLKAIIGGLVECFPFGVGQSWPGPGYCN